MNNIFLEITIIICLATAISILFRFFKQPAILAYILTGIIVGPFGQLQFSSQENLHTLAQLGITLLLFMLGLELRIKELRSIGVIAGIVGTAQVGLTLLLGYFVSISLGFSSISSLYISIALTFSSTIIIVKLLSDKKDLNSLYGKISVGLLLLQDFFAVLILMFLSAFNSGSAASIFSNLGIVLLKAAALFALVLFLSKSIFPKIMQSMARSQELLFLFSLSWVFGLSALVSSSLINFPIEIGGFLAGIALANSPENYQIVARVKSLRDFFITIFFVVLGMEMGFGDLDKIFVPALVFSAFVLLGKPLIVTLVMSGIGYKKRTSFLTGLHIGQISEFSLIIIFLGSKLGHFPAEIVSLVTLVGIMTFTFSTYMILNDKSIYKILLKPLSFFEKKSTKEEIHDSLSELGELKNHVALIGANRMGQSILNSLLEEKEKVVVVDFDPDIVKLLKERGVPTLFGDISDFDIQEKIKLNNAKLVISTVPDLEDNILLIEGLNSYEKQNRAKIVVMAHEPEDAKELYKAGADYVILPYLVGGRHLAQLISNNHLNKIETLRSKDFEFLN